MKITVDPKHRTPVYQQIVDEAKRLIGAGELRPGTRVASVRELSQQLDVNPATVAKAYRELVREGVLRTSAKSGTFVGGAQSRLSPDASAKRLANALDRLFGEIIPCNLDETTISDAFRRRLAEFASMRGPSRTSETPPPVDQTRRTGRTPSSEDWAVW